MSYASLCMDSGDLEETLGEKQQALAKIEHAVAQKHLTPPKVYLFLSIVSLVLLMSLLSLLLQAAVVILLL